MMPPVAEALGTAKSPMTPAVVVEVQLLPGFVTVRVYVPTVFTLGFCWVELNPPGPDQEKVAPGVVELPVMLMVWVPQVTVPPAALISGKSVLPVTFTVAAAVQPLAVLVTVTM